MRTAMVLNVVLLLGILGYIFLVKAEPQLKRFYGDHGRSYVDPNH